MSFSFCLLENHSIVTTLQILYWLDDLFSLFVIGSFVSIHIPLHYPIHWRIAYRFITQFVILWLILLFEMNTYRLIIPIICVHVIIFIKVTQIAQWKLTDYKRNIYLLFSLACIIVAYWLKSNDAIYHHDTALSINSLDPRWGQVDLYHYALYHSLWHSFSGLAMIFNILILTSTCIPLYAHIFCK